MSRKNKTTPPDFFAKAIKKMIEHQNYINDYLDGKITKEELEKKGVKLLKPF